MPEIFLSEFEKDYALTMANALFADYLAKHPSATAYEKCEMFRELVSSGIFEAQTFTSGNKVTIE